MNLLPTVSRACSHQNLPFRTLVINPLHASQRQTQRSQPRLQPRHLTTSSHSHAQPIDLTSQTTPASPSETSTLASSILSRASTNPTTKTRTKPTPSTPSSSQQQPSSTPSKPLSTTSPTLHLATVTRTNTMTHTIQLTRQTQTFDPFLQKHYTRPTRLLAHDPNPAGFIREGDVVEYGLFSEVEQGEMEAKRAGLERRLIESGKIRLRTRKGKMRDLREVGVRGKRVRWVVRGVVTPFGVGLKEREGREEVSA